MADFPALVPSTYPVVPGRWGGAIVPALDGTRTPIRHSSAEIGRSISLTFPGISRSDLLAIRSHYLSQRSGLDPFQFDPVTLPSALTPAGHAWHYSSRPEVVDHHQDYHDVECTFRCEPRGPLRPYVPALRAVATLSGGYAQQLFAACQATISGGNPGDNPLAAAASISGGIGSNELAGTALVVGTARSYTDDPDYNKVQLLIHGSGADGQAVFVDSSSNKHLITRTGGPAISTAQGPFGTGSIYFDGDNDHLSFPAISFGANDDVCLEAWCRPNSSANLGIFGNGSSGNDQLMAILNDKLYVYWEGNETSGGTIAANTAYWLRVTRASGVLRLFVDGTLVATASGTNTRASTIDRLGRCIYRGDYAGYIAEARVTITSARSTATYTVQSAPFPDS